MTLLEDAEWAKWSDSAIAKACSVDHKTVAKIRADYLGNSQDEQVSRTVERNGKTYQQNTANIGTHARNKSLVTVTSEKPANAMPTHEP